MALAPFVRTGSGVHPMIDFAALRRCYPDLPIDVYNITSASHIIGWEVMRERYGISDPDVAPCDLFVWGTGEPPDRRLTRVGGVPWLPKQTPWPVVGDVVTNFLCQFDFRDSRDLKGQRAAGPLPGDLLLVFVAGEEGMLWGNERDMRFVWASADETEVYSAADVPEPTRPFEFVTAWGARYRTTDVPTKLEQAHEIPESEGCWDLPTLWGTKIGGVPYSSQETNESVPNDYLCQLVSIQASHETAWPWIDRETPLSLYDDEEEEEGIAADKNCLMLGDMGELTFFLRDDGTITVAFACG